MNVTATSPKLESLRSAYATSLEKVNRERAELDTATLECNQRAATADKLANKINRWVAARNKMPMVGMGSFMVGISTVQMGVFSHSPLLLGIGLAGFAVCAACIVGIETWKVRGPRMRAEHDGLYAQFQSSLNQVSGKTASLQAAVSTFQTAETALRAEEASIDELQRLLKPPQLGGIAERLDAVVVGGIRVPKRPNPDKK